MLSDRGSARQTRSNFLIAFRAGVLVCLDGYMNVAMEQTEEHVDGVLQNKYGDCFIRGNNGE
jgi:U6 snRNA-associated Sm-like protein LSm6